MKAWCLLLNFFCMSLFAMPDIGHALKDFFNSVSDIGDAEQDEIYDAQRAGYAVGGRAISGRHLASHKLVKIDLPRINSGCGSIDVYMGGLSFISKERFKQLFESVRSNATGFAVHLVTEETMPIVANVTKYLQDQVSKINQANINSCEMGEALVGDLWSKTRADAQRSCATVALNQQQFSSWSDAKQACGEGGRFSHIMNQPQGSANHRSDTGFLNQNLTWSIIRKMDVGFGPEMSSLLMSLLGSVMVLSGDDNRPEAVLLPSLARDPQMLNALLSGGDVEIYQCSSLADDCLHPKENSVISIRKEDSLIFMVKDMMQALVAKIRATDQPGVSWSRDERRFLSMMRVPLYKILSVHAAYEKDKSHFFELNHLAEMIALDVLYEFVSQSASRVQKTALMLPMSDEIRKHFLAGLSQALEHIRAQERSSQWRMQVAEQWVGWVERMDQKISRTISHDINQKLKSFF